MVFWPQEYMGGIKSSLDEAEEGTSDMEDKVEKTPN